MPKKEGGPPKAASLKRTQPTRRAEAAPKGFFSPSVKGKERGRENTGGGKITTSEKKTVPGT